MEEVLFISMQIRSLIMPVGNLKMFYGIFNESYAVYTYI